MRILRFPLMMIALSSYETLDLTEERANENKNSETRIVFRDIFDLFWFLRNVFTGRKIKEEEKGEKMEPLPFYNSSIEKKRNVFMDILSDKRLDDELTNVHEKMRTYG